MTSSRVGKLFHTKSRQTVFVAENLDSQCGHQHRTPAAAVRCGLATGRIRLVAYIPNPTDLGIGRTRQEL